MNAETPHELKIGDVVADLVTKPIRPLALALFAGGSGDHNPIHLDREFAEENGFPNVFAHGMLSMAYLGRLLTDAFSPEQLRGFNVRFVSVTPLGAQVTCSGKVVELLEVNGEHLAKFDLVAKLSDGTVTLTGDATVALG